MTWFHVLMAFVFGGLVSAVAIALIPGSSVWPQTVRHIRRLHWHADDKQGAAKHRQRMAGVVEDPDAAERYYNSGRASAFAEVLAIFGYSVHPEPPPPKRIDPSKIKCARDSDWCDGRICRDHGICPKADPE